MKTREDCLNRLKLFNSRLLEVSLFFEDCPDEETPRKIIVLGRHDKAEGYYDTPIDDEVFYFLEHDEPVLATYEDFTITRIYNEN
jgi:hypothetical protein